MFCCLLPLIYAFNYWHIIFNSQLLIYGMWYNSIFMWFILLLKLTTSVSESSCKIAHVLFHLVLFLKIFFSTLWHSAMLHLLFSPPLFWVSHLSKEALFLSLQKSYSETNIWSPGVPALQASWIRPTLLMGFRHCEYIITLYNHLKSMRLYDTFSHNSVALCSLTFFSCS